MASKKSASNGIVWVGLGGLFGIIVDFLYQTNAIPGHSTPLEGCNALTMGDAMQIGGLSGANVVSNVMNNFTFSALTSGMILGNLAPKIMAMMGKPRYFIYDLSSTGSINPILRQQGQTPKAVAPKATTTARYTSYR